MCGIQRLWLTLDRLHLIDFEGLGNIPFLGTPRNEGTDVRYFLVYSANADAGYSIFDEATNYLLAEVFGAYRATQGFEVSQGKLGLVFGGFGEAAKRESAEIFAFHGLPGGFDSANEHFGIEPVIEDSLVMLGEFLRGECPALLFSVLVPSDIPAGAVLPLVDSDLFHGGSFKWSLTLFGALYHCAFRFASLMQAGFS